MAPFHLRQRGGGGCDTKPTKPKTQIVESDQEAILLMNDTSFGLTAGVYTKDERIAMAILRSLDTGTGYWNCCDRGTSTLSLLPATLSLWAYPIATLAQLPWSPTSSLHRCIRSTERRD